MNKYESLASDTFLSGYNESLSYEEVLEAIYNGDTYSAIIWGPLEDKSPEFIIDCIETLKELLKRGFIPKSNEVQL